MSLQPTRLLALCRRYPDLVKEILAPGEKKLLEPRHEIGTVVVEVMESPIECQKKKKKNTVVFVFVK